MVYILHEQKQVLLVTSAITAVVAPPVNVLNRIIAFHNWYLVHDTILCHNTRRGYSNSQNVQTAVSLPSSNQKLVPGIICIR